jgi:hypothetical protein
VSGRATKPSVPVGPSARLQLWQPDTSVGASIRVAVCAVNLCAGIELTKPFAPHAGPVRASCGVSRARLNRGDQVPGRLS